jgi:hypothetical protein
MLTRDDVTRSAKSVAEVKAMQDRITAIEEERGRLRLALEPFALLAEKWGVQTPDPQWTDDDIMLFANREGRLSEPPLVLTVGDFRLAARVSQPLDGRDAAIIANGPREGERDRLRLALSRIANGSYPEAAEWFMTGQFKKLFERCQEIARQASPREDGQ